MFGSSSLEDLYGKKLSEIFHQKCFNNLEAFINSPTFNDFITEDEFTNKAGESFKVKLSLSPIIEKEQFIGFLLMMVDISEYKAALELLKGEKFRLANAQRVAKIGSWETVISSMKVIWSEETHKIFETDPNSFEPTHEAFLNLVHPEDRTKVDAAFNISLKSTDDHVIEHRILLKDGKIKHVEEHWKVYFDDVLHHVRVFGTCQDISDRKLSEERIQHLAFYDSLTNLPNRQLLLDRLHLVLKNSIRHQNHNAVLFIDLDNFKNLNDTQGHNVGDLLLIETASRLKSCIRDSDTIGRIGGDEFVVIMQNLDPEVDKAAAAAETLCKSILFEVSKPYMLDDLEYFGSASIGVCLFSKKGISVNELLKRADTAMYQAKNSGRNASRFFDPEMQASLEARSALEKDLRNALKEKQFKLYYQMQVDNQRNIIGAEALIRWMHPKSGLINPLNFIPLAEETSLIIPIGLWVLDEACAQLKNWQSEPITAGLTISINVSARQFHQTDFVEQVINTVQKHEINPENLKLELTESLVLNNIDETILKMNILKKLGIQFSLDDFGTGYSSLSYLTKLPLDELKIDRSFVKNIFTNEKDSIVVQTIIGMAQTLEFQVIAEGVETEHQWSFLVEHGCKFCQGYYFGRPVPEKVFQAEIRK